MDAAQTNIKKIALFLVTALLLTAPFQASAQTLAVSSTSVAIGSSTCNDSQSVTLTSSGAPITFTVSVNYPNGNTNGDDNGNWLYTNISGVGTTSTGLTFTATTGTGTSGVMLNIGLNRSIGAVTDTAQVIIQDTNNVSDKITVTAYYAQNTSCGSNPNGNGFISITPGTLALSAATNGQQSATVTIQNITGSGLTFGLSVSPTGSWLSASTTTTVISGNGSTTVDVTANGALTAGVGSYTGFVTIAPQTGFGSSLNIPVAFTVTNGTGTGTGPTSGTLTVNGSTSSTYTTAFSYIAPNPPGGQCIGLQDTATGANSYTSLVTTSNGGNWLFANNQISTDTIQILAPGNGACINLSLNPGVAFNLPSGAYQGSVGITSSSGSTAVINVNYYVSAGKAPGITVNEPASGLIYVFPNVAANSSVGQEQVFSLTAATGYVLGVASLTNGGNGFSMSSPIASNNTETFTVMSNSAGLPVGIYATTVTMSSSLGSATNTTTITIVLPVGQAGATTTGTTTKTVVAPASLAFQQQSGSSFWTSGKEAQTITITGTEGTQWSATVVYSTGSGWLNFDSGSSSTFGNSPASLTVDLFNGVTGLSPSSTPYTATVNIVTTSGTYYVSVSLLVTQSNVPVLLGIPASATFSATTGTATPTQSVTVVGSDNTASSTSPPISAGTPTQTWVSASTSGNTAGVYQATIPIQATAYSNPINYPVVMIVNGGGTGTSTGALTLSTTSIPFTNVTAQISENLNVTASTSTQFTVSSTETSCTGNTWLIVTHQTYTASSTVTPILVAVNPAGIASGTTCTGQISLASVGTQTVSVSMTVGGSSGSGNVTVSPTTMSFAYTQNQSVPGAQTATVVNALSGTASIPFTVSASATWITTNVTSASTPYNSPGLSVSVVPGSMGPNTYSGTVTITPSGGSAVTISVTLTITGTAVVSATCSGTGCSGATTLNMSYLVGGTSPTATIQVTGGGSTAAFTAVAASGAGWLAITPTSGTTPNNGTFNLSVSVVSTVLSSLTPGGSPYTGTITVSGTSPATGTTIVNVTLAITAPLPVITGITNAASGVGGTANVSVSVGEIISIYGTAASPIGPAASVQLNSTTCPPTCTQVPTTMGGVQVKFVPGEIAAPLLFVDDAQINAVVPYGVAGIAGLSVEVLYLSQTSNLFPVSLTATAPGLFTSNSSGTGQVAANQYDNLGNYQNQNLAAAPAKAGWTLVLYMTGEGQVSPNVNSGAVTVYNSSANPPVPVPVAGAPTVHIGNQPATVTFYGEAPGLVSGVLQINVLVPAGAGTGAVPISVSIGTATSQASLTVALQ
jgi:uncharacterized protein (TIGR03437 family)